MKSPREGRWTEKRSQDQGANMSKVKRKPTKETEEWPRRKKGKPSPRFQERDHRHWVLLVRQVKRGLRTGHWNQQHVVHWWPWSSCNGVVEAEVLVRVGSRQIFIKIFTAALFVTASTWKQSKCSTTGEWINKWAESHLYSGIVSSNKKIDYWHISTWMNLKKHCAERSWKWKSTYYTIPFIWSSKPGKTNLYW